MVGKVNVQNNQGSIRLSWRIDGQRFSLNPGLKYDKDGIRLASGIAATMELDLKSGNFDASLERYKKLANPTYGMGAKIREEMLRIKIEPHQLLHPFHEQFIKAIQPSERTYESHHAYVYRWLKKNHVTLGNCVEKLQNETNWGYYTFRDRINYLNAFLNWCFDTKLIESIPTRRFKIPAKREAKTNRKPFTSEEVRLILEAVETNKVCSKFSKTPHSHYYHFIRFLFTYGCRPAEVIGLQWKHINVENREILIAETLARGNKGETTSQFRVRKDTKTGNKRILPIDDFFYEFFSQNKKGKSLEALIFTSPNGLAIDDRNFLNRIWKPLLTKLGIEYRTPYSIRHTFGTKAVSQGIPLTEVADLMGHTSPKTTMDFYVHKQQSRNLPSII